MAIRTVSKRMEPIVRMRPIEHLSRGALEALVKMLVASKKGGISLVPSSTGRRYYEELRESGYAYLTPGGYAINGDALASGVMLQAVGLRK